MVHLLRGRGFARTQMMGLRHMRPPMLRPDFRPVPPFGLPRGELLSRPPMRPRPLPPPRMVQPPPGLPHRPRLPPHHIPRPFPPIHPTGRNVGIPPPMPPGLPLRGPIRPQAPIRGMFPKRGASVKFLGSSDSPKLKKNQKRKEKTEETEINKPWVTETLKSEIQKKHLLYKVAREKNTESDWQAFKEQRILVGKISKVAKLEYIGTHPEADVLNIMYGVSTKKKKT